MTTFLILAAAQVAAQPAPTAQASVDPKDKVICRKIDTGSAIGQTICKPARMWQEDEENGKRILLDFQRQRGVNRH